MHVDNARQENTAELTRGHRRGKHKRTKRFDDYTDNTRQHSSLPLSLLALTVINDLLSKHGAQWQAKRIEKERRVATEDCLLLKKSQTKL